MYKTVFNKKTSLDNIAMLAAAGISSRLAVVLMNPETNNLHFLEEGLHSSLNGVNPSYKDRPSPIFRKKIMGKSVHLTKKVFVLLVKFVF